ncbi:DUF2232 domain-containing protein [Chelatococcus asaccharovorans]|uniref:DUF2232 domain-containing protein n=1 Tax=Chelatococcus asaccharovorans TaxID=28210 RepID=UPI00224C6573|nr:DUF2232 domain-containing protein [Chelatococcus asaccharovorans]CAH1668007.1 conserved membrane hypothetical protein [Chelatococcus asaccharovorans]CAH1680483.1 conserved membrane hypothetical protein [Chelatococcus asaccharovorans]
MAISILVGLGAGIVSALLFAVVISGSVLALLLSYIAPLPILVAALGWNHRAGLVAVVTGAASLAIIFAPASGIAYAIGIALPAWWLGYLALLARPGENGPEWYPIGRVLAWSAAIAAGVTLAGAWGIGGSYADFEATMGRAIRAFLTMEGAPAGSGAPSPAPSADALGLPAGIALDDLVDAIITAVPPLAAASFVLMLILNLWLAAKTVAISQRLPRPWPVIADTTMPRTMLPALVVAAVLSVLGSGFVGLTATALAGALICAYALQGLAALHALTRGKPGRPFILGLTYAILVIFLVWILPVLALFGIIDTLLGLRARRAGIAGSPP